MPLAPIINMREFINNVEVLCQRLDVTWPPSNTMHICVGCQEIIGFYLKPWKSHAHTTTVALQTFINISFQCFCTVFRRRSMSQWWASLFNRVQWSNKKKMECGIMHSKVLQGLLHSLFLDICFLIIVKVHLPHIQKMFLNRQATEISNSMHADCVSKELFKQKD